MNEAIISGIFTVSGALVGAVGAIVAGNISRRKVNLKHKVEQLAKQIEAYWNLESLYSDEFGKVTNTASKTVKEDFRSKVENMGYERPTMTANKAREIIKDL